MPDTSLLLAANLVLVVAALAGLAVVVGRLNRLRDTDTDLIALVRQLDQGALDVERALREEAARSREEAARAARELREEVVGGLSKLGGDLRASLSEQARIQNERLDAVRGTVEGRLDSLRKENEAKLEQMRQTVDEKLQGTLEKRLGESFGIVSKQLEMVHKSVGEMQTLATGVGDLKRVLTNVKTRGTWGEVALGNLLEQLMTPEQVARNAEVRPGSGERVEFAIRLPGRGDSEAEVLLPIDAKFPQEDYQRLVEAAETGDKAAEEAALKGLETRIRAAAQDICDKYIAPPHSTDFGVLYLPTEGLYAEALRRPGLADGLNLQCRVVIAGPTTLAALLNSLQLGFRTLAIQQRSSEVWQVLGAVKTEFAKYGEVLDKVQKRLRQADGDIESVRRRERAIGRKLRSVESLSEGEAGRVLQMEDYLVEAEALPGLGEARE